MKTSMVDGQRVGKFGKGDMRFLGLRQQLSKDLGPQELWSVIDHWGLYTGIQTLARNLALIQALSATARIPGDVVEFGAWKGATTLLLAKALRLMDPNGVKVVHAFSRWGTGFSPIEWQPEDNRDAAAQYQGDCQGDKALLQDLITLFELDGAVELYDGDIVATWARWKEDYPQRKVSLALFDMDLYRPTVAAFAGLHERLLPGAIILMDQAQHVDWPGEGQAMNEFLQTYPKCYDVKTVPGTRQPDLMLVRR